jgi:hypothetical protein
MQTQQSHVHRHNLVLAAVTSAGGLVTAAGVVNIFEAGCTRARSNRLAAVACKDDSTGLVTKAWSLLHPPGLS